MFGKTGGRSHFAKPMVAIFPDGRQIKTASRQEMADFMKREYNLSIGRIQYIIKTGRPYYPYPGICSFFMILFMLLFL
jgi:hypothetical protein